MSSTLICSLKSIRETVAMGSHLFIGKRQVHRWTSQVRNAEITCHINWEKERTKELEQWAGQSSRLLLSSGLEWNSVLSSCLPLLLLLLFLVVLQVSQYPPRGTQDGHKQYCHSNCLLLRKTHSHKEIVEFILCFSTRKWFCFSNIPQYYSKFMRVIC